MKFCPYCMKPADSKYCPYCGGETDRENDPCLLPVGTVIRIDSSGKSYRIGACLGRGGFGATYTGAETKTGQRVAVKEYFPNRCANRAPDGQVVPKPGDDEIYEGGRFSFVKEARMLAALEGMPSVVQGLDYQETNNTAYLVMEYLDGTPLYRVVNERGKIPAEQLLPMLRPLLHDIGKLHAVNVIHRDISPDNVMWMRDGSLKLLDFGCARWMEDGKSLTLAVKPGFAPAEQYQSHGQGTWTDVYALAATIYYCLTGIIPPSAPDRWKEDTLQPPTALGAVLSPEEEDALLWGMTLKKELRPANMEVFAKRLFPALPVPEPVPEPTPGLRKWLKNFFARFRNGGGGTL